MAPSDVAGWVAGFFLSPVTGLISTARRGRMFHPRGVLCAGEAEPASPAMRLVGARLAGPVLVRWSSALWKESEWHDVLGCSLRFTQAPLSSEPAPADQDLLLATIQRPWTMPLSPFTTDVRDFLSNAYFGVSPFHVEPLGRSEWRLTASGVNSGGGTRAERLAGAMAEGRAELTLSCAPYPGPLHRPRKAAFEPVVKIRLSGLVALDDERLRFDPFRSGRGIHPVGFVHHMRRAAYRASQAARPGRS